MSDESNEIPELVDEELDRHLDSLETRLLGRSYLVGDGLAIADLSVTGMIGHRMTLPMIRKIHEEYGVPPEVLIQDYALKRTGS